MRPRVERLDEFFNIVIKREVQVSPKNFFTLLARSSQEQPLSQEEARPFFFKGFECSLRHFESFSLHKEIYFHYNLSRLASQYNEGAFFFSYPETEVSFPRKRSKFPRKGGQFPRKGSKFTQKRAEFLFGILFLTLP